MSAGERWMLRAVVASLFLLLIALAVGHIPKGG
jgi:hypothetical protein